MTQEIRARCGPPTVRSGEPIAVTFDRNAVLLWFASGYPEKQEILRLPCASEEHAEALMAYCHVAFGLRTKENSFTTGLLHKDIETYCGL